MPRLFDHEVRAHFDLNIEQVDPLRPKGRCLHCDARISQQGGNLKRHLGHCGPYRQLRAGQEVITAPWSNSMDTQSPTLNLSIRNNSSLVRNSSVAIHFYPPPLPETHFCMTTTVYLHN